MVDNRISVTTEAGKAVVPTRRGFLSTALGGLSAFLGGLTLAGCARTAQSTGIPASPEETSEDGKPSEDCVSGLTGLQLRAVEEGQAVTMDYREDRLTLVLDAQKRITRAYVG